MVGFKVGPALRRHPVGPGAVGPELAVLVDLGLDEGRSAFFFDNFTMTEVHAVVQGIALADYAGRGTSALTPVLAVIHFQDPRRAENVVGSAKRLPKSLNRPVFFQNRKPPDFRRVGSLGQA